MKFYPGFKVYEVSKLNYFKILTHFLLKIQHTHNVIVKIYELLLSQTNFVSIN